MHKVIRCRASRDYRLWVAFDDGLEGSVFLGDLLEISAFSVWRDVEAFCLAEPDTSSSAVVWKAGIRLDADILHQDLASNQRREFKAPGFAPAFE